MDYENNDQDKNKSFRSVDREKNAKEPNVKERKVKAISPSASSMHSRSDTVIVLIK